MLSSSSSSLFVILVFALSLHCTMLHCTLFSLALKFINAIGHSACVNVGDVTLPLYIYFYFYSIFSHTFVDPETLFGNSSSSRFVLSNFHIHKTPLNNNINESNKPKQMANLLVLLLGFHAFTKFNIKL